MALGRYVRGNINPRKGFWASSKGRNYANVRTGEPGERKTVRYSFRNLGVEYVYGKGSRVVKGTGRLLGVRLKSGERGWLSKDGRFMSEADVLSICHSLDATFAVQNMGFSFEGLWNSMSAAQRADVADRLWDIDWDDFWGSKYEEDAPFDQDWLDAVYDVVDVFDSVVNG